MNKWVCGACMLAVIVLMSGCVNRHVSRNSLQGRPIDRDAFSQIKEGKSSGGWTLSVMGEPTRRIESETGSEIWEWTYEESKSVRGQLLVFSNDSLVIKRKVARVEIKNGVVVHKWLDTTDTVMRDELN